MFDFQQLFRPIQTIGEEWVNLQDQQNTIGDNARHGVQQAFGMRQNKPFGDPKKQDDAATLLQPAEMPSLTSSDTRLAGRRAKSRLLSRGGRASTILTDDPLGG